MAHGISGRRGNCPGFSGESECGFAGSGCPSGVLRYKLPASMRRCQWRWADHGIRCRLPGQFYIQGRPAASLELLRLVRFRSDMGEWGAQVLSWGLLPPGNIYPIVVGVLPTIKLAEEDISRFSTSVGQPQNPIGGISSRGLCSAAIRDRGHPSKADAKSPSKFLRFRSAAINLKRIVLQANRSPTNENKGRKLGQRRNYGNVHFRRQNLSSR